MSGRDLLVRAVPVDLFDWVDSQARTTNFTKRELVITALKRMRDDEMYDRYPLFEGLVDDYQVDVDSFPFKFIDLFAGIGGFRLGLQRIGGQCVFTSEWDKFAQKTYEQWFGDRPYGDINQINPRDIPDHDVLAAGFPCQPFSIAGVSKKRSLGVADGFQCERQGNLFFRICEIANVKKPPVMILENVKNLKSHDKKRTWQVIESELRSLGYHVFERIIDAQHWVPQHRERIFIVCFSRDFFPERPDFRFPEKPAGDSPQLSDILEENPPEKYTLTDHLWNYLQNYKKKHEAKGNGFGFGLNEDFSGVSRTLSARYYKDGSEVLISRGQGKTPRRLTIVEAARLMGYGEVVEAREDMVVSDTQAYKQLGNSVVPAVVTEVGQRLLPHIRCKWREQNGCTLAGARNVSGVSESGVLVREKYVDEPPTAKAGPKTTDQPDAAVATTTKRKTATKSKASATKPAKRKAAAKRGNQPETKATKTTKLKAAAKSKTSATKPAKRKAAAKKVEQPKAVVATTPKRKTAAKSKASATKPAKRKAAAKKATKPKAVAATTPKRKTTAKSIASATKPAKRKAAAKKATRPETAAGTTTKRKTATKSKVSATKPAKRKAAAKKAGQPETKATKNTKRKTTAKPKSLSNKND